MNIITNTNYNGRLHLGYGDEGSVSKCLGKSINAYRNFIFKFFTRLFSISMDIEMGGKSICVNKVSLKKHLESIGLEGEDIEKINRIGYTTFIQQNEAKLIIQNDTLGENFSDKKRMKLFEKMIRQLEVNNTQAVKRYLRKGAYIDREFCKSEPTGKLYLVNFKEMKKWIFGVGSEFKIYSYTPLALAAEKENQSVAKFIAKAKDNDISSDKKETFKYRDHSHCYGYGNHFNWTTEREKFEKVTNRDGIIILTEIPVEHCLELHP